VRVDFIGKVISPNQCVSAITSWSASLLEIVLLDWKTEDTSGAMEIQLEPESFTALGGVRYGTLVVADANGRELHIRDVVTSLHVVPVSLRPLPLDVPVPAELDYAAQKSEHRLAYRETRFRENDTVRVRATVQRGEVVIQDGYRDSPKRVLVPVPGEPIVLYETI